MNFGHEKNKGCDIIILFIIISHMTSKIPSPLFYVAIIP